MIIVVVPFIILLAIILIPRIPVIGGNIQAGLLITGCVALAMGGVWAPVDWLLAWIDGLDQIALVIGLSIFGSIYAETQVEIGTMDTVINTMRSTFGHSPKGLIIAVMIALTMAGSLLGDVIAASTVIGVLVIKSLAEMRLSGEQISATIVMGACLGSIMPPITQAVTLSAQLVGLPSADPVINISYITVGLCLIVCCTYVANMFIRIKALPEDLIPKETARQILAKNWTRLIPLAVLIILVVLRTGFHIDLIDMCIGALLDLAAPVPILRGLTDPIILSVIFVMLLSFCYPQVRRRLGKVVGQGLKNVRISLAIQVSAGLMLGAFHKAGQIEAVRSFAIGLNETLLKLGGSVALCMIGMLTGSQATAQNTIFTFFSKTLLDKGLDPIHTAVAGAHLAMSGQGLPPADLTTFVVAGLVGGILGIKVDPLKSMFYSSVMCVCFLIVGIMFLYI